MLRRITTEDRGASALLIAGTMVLILGIAAVVIDGGLGFSERRQAQSGTDFGALAALQKAVSCPAPCTTSQAANNGAAEAVAVVDANLPGRFTLADWSACSDPDRPPEFTVVASTPTTCVSFTANLDKARVNLPDDRVDTAFGGFIGLNSLTIGAEAEAGSTIKDLSIIIPFTPTATQGSEACLFSNQAPQTVPPCDGAASGFFGYLDIALYGKDDETGNLITPSTCIGGDTNLRVAINLAKGGDHSFVEYDPVNPDPIINDHDACPNSNEDVNEVRVETGSPTGGIADGLINGVSGSINGQPFAASPGRIVCNDSGPNPYSTGCVNVRGNNLDHTGLWEFLDSGCAGTSTNAQMRDCLETGSPVFDASLAQHPRFAAIPILWPNPPDTAAPTGPGDYKIKEFQAVWLETLYFDCNANWCQTIHSPGEDFSAGPGFGDPGDCSNPIEPAERNCGWSDTSGPDSVEGMVALLIDEDMLPAEISDNFPSQETERTYALTK